MRYMMVLLLFYFVIPAALFWGFMTLPGIWSGIALVGLVVDLAIIFGRYEDSWRKPIED